MNGNKTRKNSYPCPKCKTRHWDWEDCPRTRYSNFPCVPNNVEEDEIESDWIDPYQDKFYSENDW
jgi:hypothetical protein